MRGSFVSYLCSEDDTQMASRISCRRDGNRPKLSAESIIDLSHDRLDKVGGL